MPPEAPSAQAGADGPGSPPAAPVRWLKGFGAFWWDFLVSDTPELLVGVLVVIGVVALLARTASVNAAAVVAFPLLVAVVLGLSLYRARPRP
jgi:hypothetical protein